TNLVIALTLALWPLSLMLTNAFKDIGNDLKNYYHFSIFAPDDQAPLIINTKRSVYDNDFIGRLFNNKATFIYRRFKANFFALTDPNNYFFGFHPREIVRENLNLDKFPFISIVFLLYGLYRLNLMKRGRGLLLLFFILTCLLSLANFDKVDFILYPILATFMVHGIKQLGKEKPKLFATTAILLIIFSFPQYLRAFVNLHP
ncbi:MAG: hypothetical protein WAV56_02750, partial [Microgenomates group bacterium]